MIATNYSEVRNKLKDYCDLATDNAETILVTRKENKNVVILSLERFNEMEKELRNVQYLAKINRGFEQIQSGNGHEHELIDIED